MDAAFKYWQTNAAELESSYPYTASDDTCKFNAALGVVKAVSHIDVATKDADALKNAVAIGPVSVAI
jgi:hypothetical protein